MPVGIDEAGHQRSAVLVDCCRRAGARLAPVKQADHLAVVADQ